MEILSESDLEEHNSIFKEFAQQHPRLKNSNEKQIKEFFIGHITNPTHFIYIERNEHAKIQQFALAMMHDDYESAWHLGVGYQLKDSTHTPEFLLEKKTHFFLDIIDSLQKKPLTKIINIGGHFKEVELEKLLETKGFKWVDRRKMKIVKKSLKPMENFPSQMHLIPWDDKYIEEISQLCLDFSNIRADKEIFPYFQDLQSTRKFSKKIKENAWGDFYPELSFILLYKETPIGICFITEFDPAFGYIPYFGIHPNYQKMGLGAKLLSNSLLNVFNLKIKWDRVELDVTQGIPAESSMKKWDLNLYVNIPFSTGIEFRNFKRRIIKLNPKKILDGLYLVGSESLSGSGDCLIYALGIGKNKICLIDAGTQYAQQILDNITKTELKDRDVSDLILTHCHFDHIGAAHQFQQLFPKIKTYAHSWDLAAITGQPNTQGLTAADWYGQELIPPKIDYVLKKDPEILMLEGTKLICYHTPGHTPGSIAVLYENEEGIKVLFGQDVHGPFMEEFNSNINDWVKSMKRLISLAADILCEGHYGIFEGKEKVKKFIEGQLRANGF